MIHSLYLLPSLGLSGLTAPRVWTGLVARSLIDHCFVSSNVILKNSSTILHNGSSSINIPSLISITFALEKFSRPGFKASGTTTNVDALLPRHCCDLRLGDSPSADSRSAGWPDGQSARIRTWLKCWGFDSNKLSLCALACRSVFGPRLVGDADVPGQGGRNRSQAANRRFEVT